MANIQKFIVALYGTKNQKTTRLRLETAHYGVWKREVTVRLRVSIR